MSNEHIASVTIAQQATRCPFFQADHGGCPFDPKHPHSFDMSKIKECPEFKKGCPFKDVKMERLSECPAFKDGKCPFDGNHQVDLSKVKDCPAFKNGCPYMHMHSHKDATQVHAGMSEHAATTEIAQQASKCPFFNKAQGHGCPFDPAHPHSFDMSKIKECPAFEKGCPYKGVDMSRIKECPAFKDGKCPFDGDHKVDLSRVKECPAFKSGCPYASMTLPSPAPTPAPVAEAAPQAAQCPFAHLHGKAPNPHSH
eukprot:TRINITY_DN2806_c0_g1_i2.p1 TRINITY_DN2806_c0_g1~~TRINITY_DN2806_c0_g1_i2.p1  ORF type:complete len:254 (+),score=51.59 TRINITY_DN2806_c0_g1_i2:121-882(+)